jgi:hypothetical protein
MRYNVYIYHDWQWYDGGGLVTYVQALIWAALTPANPPPVMTVFMIIQFPMVVSVMPSESHVTLEVYPLLPVGFDAAPNAA